MLSKIEKADYHMIDSTMAIWYADVPYKQIKEKGTLAVTEFTGSHAPDYNRQFRDYYYSGNERLLLQDNAWEQHTSVIDMLNGLQYCPVIRRPVLYRGVNNYREIEYRIGQTVKWESFSSCTLDEQTALDFSDREGGIIWRIRDCEGYSVNFLSHNQGEKELILLPCVLKIEGIFKTSKRQYVSGYDDEFHIAGIQTRTIIDCSIDHYLPLPIWLMFPAHLECKKTLRETYEEHGIDVSQPYQSQEIVCESWNDDQPITDTPYAIEEKSETYSDKVITIACKNPSLFDLGVTMADIEKNHGKLSEYGYANITSMQEMAGILTGELEVIGYGTLYVKNMPEEDDTPDENVKSGSTYTSEPIKTLDDLINALKGK